MNINNIKKEIEKLQEKGFDESTIKAVIFSKYGEKYSSLFNGRDSQSLQEQKEENISAPREKPSWLNLQQDHQIQINKKVILIPLMILIAIVLFVSLVQISNKKNNPFEIIKNINVNDLQTLIDKNDDFDPNMLDKYGNSLFSTAVEKNSNQEVIKILIEKGADIDRKINGKPIIIYSFKNQNPEITELLIESGVKINVIDENSSSTPLSYAITFSNENKNSLVIVKTLLENGANTKYQDPFLWRSILHEAAYHDCSLEIFKLLIQYNADVNAIDKLYETPLMTVAEHCTNPDIIDTLIDSGADFYAVDFLNDNVFDYAEKNENTEMLERLKEKEKSVPKKIKKTYYINESEIDLGFSDYVYRKLVRDEYVIPGSLYNFKGKISQWIENEGTDYYMIYTKDTGYGYHDHLVMIAVPPLLRDVESFIEGDIVIFENALYVQPFEYKTTLGTTKVIPGFGCDQKTIGQVSY